MAEIMKRRAIRLWVRANSHLMSQEDVDLIIERLRTNPAKPFVLQEKEERSIKRWEEWAKKKLGMTP